MKNKGKFRILVINPGSTSTKTALFEGDKEVYQEELKHSMEELKPFSSLIDQCDFRKSLILKSLEKNGYSLNDLDCLVARGGLLRPIPSGTYQVNPKMLQDLNQGTYGIHASNLGAILGQALAEPNGLPVFVVDPVVVDELEEEARLSGLPEITRKSVFHALNHKAVARTAAREMGRNYEDTNLIVAHLGGGITVGAHRKGKVVEVNNGLIGEGPIAPTRSGGLPVLDVIELALSGRYSRDELRKKVTSQGGITAYLGTSDMLEIENRVKQGDSKATLVYRTMAYQIAREIGACAAVLEGKVDAILITGGLARDSEFVKLIARKVGFIAPIKIYPGGDEMKALADGALAVLNGIETIKEY
ncbi:butyrate kinase [bacterium]|nr:butyrate kinase [bacterium]